MTNAEKRRAKVKLLRKIARGHNACDFGLQQIRGKTLEEAWGLLTINQQRFAFMAARRLGFITHARQEKLLDRSWNKHAALPFSAIKTAAVKAGLV